MPAVRLHDASDRIPYDVAPHEFDRVTARALRLAREVPDPFARLLRLVLRLHAEKHGRNWYAQQRGASYRQLARIAHEAGMSKAERVEWYRVAESVPLSQRHCSWIIGRLERSPP